MVITVNLRYTGKEGAARKFVEEMTTSGTVAAIRSEVGNLRYEYYQPLDAGNDPSYRQLDGSGGYRYSPRFSHDGHHRRASGEIRSAHDR